MDVSFIGTIIELKTIGDADEKYYFHSWDRYYANLKLTIFGYITKDILVQYCAEGPKDLENVVIKMNEIMPTLDPPFYTLFCPIFRSICRNSGTFVPDPLNDVRGDYSTRWSGWDLRERFEISTYDDPFNGEGVRHETEWHKENYTDCMKANRARLQIERDILLKITESR